MIDTSIPIREAPASARQPDMRTEELAQLPKLRRCRDRRNAFGRVTLLRRVRSEFREIPGLCVTASQAARLFGLAEDVCARICEELVDEGEIQKSGRFYGAFRKDFVAALFTATFGHRGA